jgi:beta-glucosidase
LSADGSFKTRPDAAIVVFGEEPYAEFAGDRPTIEYKPGDHADLNLLKKLKAQGIPVVAVFLSGRPMWVNAHLNAADAFVAAFLPGGEGGGVADVLLADAAGKPRHDFRGKLSFSWPKRVEQAALNVGDAGYDPLFAFGYGLTYADNVTLPRLSEDRPEAATVAADGQLFARGRLPAGWRFAVAEPGGVDVPVTGIAGATGSGDVRVEGVDRDAQEDARRVTFGARGGAWKIAAPTPTDLSRESNAGYALTIGYRIDRAPSSPLRVAIGCGERCGAELPLAAAPVGGWREVAIPLRCFADKGVDMRRVTTPMALVSGGAATVSLSAVRIAVDAAPGACPAG